MVSILFFSHEHQAPLYMLNIYLPKHFAEQILNAFVFTYSAKSFYFSTFCFLVKVIHTHLDWKKSFINPRRMYQMISAQIRVKFLRKTGVHTWTESVFWDCLDTVAKRTELIRSYKKPPTYKRTFWIL